MLEALGFVPKRMAAFPGVVEEVASALRERQRYVLECSTRREGGGELHEELRTFCEDHQETGFGFETLEIDVRGDCGDANTTAALANTVSHLLSLRRAFLEDHSVTLFSEDDATFAPLQAYVRTATRRASLSDSSSSSSDDDDDDDRQEEDREEEKQRGKEAKGNIRLIEDRLGGRRDGRGFLQDVWRLAEDLADSHSAALFSSLFSPTPWGGSWDQSPDTEVRRRYADGLRALDRAVGERGGRAVGVQLFTLFDEHYADSDTLLREVRKRSVCSCREAVLPSSKTDTFLRVRPTIASGKFWSSGAFAFNRAAIAFWVAFFFGESAATNHPRIRFPPKLAPDVHQCPVDWVLWALPHDPRKGVMVTPNVPLACLDKSLHAWSARLGGPVEAVNAEDSRLQETAESYVKHLREGCEGCHETLSRGGWL
uniref:Uncharacterized protein n=1 Tax=Chromera velia CCMP2878 TaxID=1169474 RepID=A0A0G4IE47_9ALVE|eukprot:Cvel_2394.t1-p1 / transcript=Cvel_2394.t1 / gene=Cvel_2394 / organism=Chromera_velia_CCMP2878 / gene_product=hypothetical protein / transcript_product=hypothetical protein / location=Cvel_scaffold93:62144-65730(+) / protein_length=426 / sequence_SO=supercontig / SO=protein_coding / is_pseudo=false